MTGQATRSTYASRRVRADEPEAIRLVLDLLERGDARADHRTTRSQGAVTSRVPPERCRAPGEDLTVRSVRELSPGGPRRTRRNRWIRCSLRSRAPLARPGTRRRWDPAACRRRRW